MRTRRPDRSLSCLVAVAALLAWTAVASAQKVTSDEPAGVLVFPKVVVDTAGVFTNGTAVDTVIQISNVDVNNPHDIHCFWINANSCCTVPGVPCSAVTGALTTCDPGAGIPNPACQAGQVCSPNWTSTDFSVQLTEGQPIGFAASDPSPQLPCQGSQGCTTDPQEGALLSPNADPFRGELKCLEVETTDLDLITPVAGNHLVGTARIYNVTANSVDTREYNAIGIQSVETFDSGDVQSVMCLGTDGTANCPAPDYATCPATLVLDHFFDGAFPFGDADSVSTTLTMVPCTEDVEGTAETQTRTVVQMSIYNEFEQRFSSSTRVECYEATTLADIDTRLGTADDSTSVFSVGVQGTLTGQTRIRGVPGNAPYHGILAVAEENYSNGFSTAFNVHNDGGTRPDNAGDIITLPLP